MHIAQGPLYWLALNDSAYMRLRLYVWVCVCIPADVNSLVIFSADQLDEGNLVPRCENLLPAIECWLVDPLTVFQSLWICVHGFVYIHFWIFRCHIYLFLLLNTSEFHPSDQCRLICIVFITTRNLPSGHCSSISWVGSGRQGFGAKGKERLRLEYFLQQQC